MKTSRIKMGMLVVVGAGLFLTACPSLPIPGFGQGQKTQTTTTKRTEQINGQDVEEPTEDGADRETVAESETSDIGATCHKNAECAARACFVGTGELGYCTKMCNSWSDCPSHWECKRAGNAPQKICMQDNW